jgi:hypothetical protein
MPPVLMGAAVAVVVIATYVLVRRSLQAQLKPVRAEQGGPPPAPRSGHGRIPPVLTAVDPLAPGL